MKKITNETNICMNCHYARKEYNTNKLYCTNPIHEKKFVEFVDMGDKRKSIIMFGALDATRKGMKVKYKDTCKNYQPKLNMW